MSRCVLADMRTVYRWFDAEFGKKMYAAVDVYYDEGERGARSACVLFGDPRSREPDDAFIATSNTVAKYEPGNFYRRELPCIEALLGGRCYRIKAILIDGYVFLSKCGQPGLGWHVHQRLSVPVIGVAKSRFVGAEQFADQVFRGASKRPLYVTQIGYRGVAPNMVRDMHGANRIPTLLRRADQLARGVLCEPGKVARLPSDEIRSR